jgi:hypothetical protein
MDEEREGRRLPKSEEERQDEQVAQDEQDAEGHGRYSRSAEVDGEDDDEGGRGTKGHATAGR